MIIRPYNWRLDAIDINRIWKTHHSEDFSIPSVNHSVTDLVIRDDTRLVAFGFVKIFAEAILVMDLDVPKRKRVNAMKTLFMEAFSACRRSGIEQLHVSVTNPDFAELLKKHYNFETCKGEMLVVEV